jgi:hypothetical protein
MAFGILNKLFSFFHQGKGQEGTRARRLKQLAKDITNSRFARFYKPRSMEIQPAMGKFFYDLYKALSHAQVFLQNAAKSSQLKQLVVENFLDMKHLDARQRLNADYVKKRAESMPITEVSYLLKEDLTLLAGAFDRDFITKVDQCYNYILDLVHLTGYDYFLFLRKFDSTILERNFNITPQFRLVRGTALVEELKDFLDVFYPLDIEADWTLPLRILKVYKNGLDVVTPQEWSKLLGSLRELRRSSILELIIRHISQDPGWEFKTRIKLEHIAETYLEERRQEVDQALTGFLYSQKQNQVNALAQELFGDSEVKRLQYYTEKEGEAFLALGLEGFTYARSLNYLKAFFTDFFETGIRNICELLLIRGFWSSIEQSKEMSETFHILLANADRLSALEQSLAETGEAGSRLRNVTAKSGRNQSQLRSLGFVLKRVNEEAWDILSSTAETLIQLGGQFKEILLDIKNEGGLIKNYRELQRDADPPLTPHLIQVYKHIYAYLQIQQLLCGSDGTSISSLSE